MFYIDQPSAALGPLNSGDGTYWMALHSDRTSSVSGWSRQQLTHYLFQQNATKPAEPAGGIIFGQATVSGGVITAVDRVAPKGPIRSTTVTPGAFAEEFGVLADDATDNSLALQRALNTTQHVTLPCGTIRFGTTLNIQKGQLLEGCGHGAPNAEQTGTVLRYTGTGDGLLIDGSTLGAAFNFGATIRNLAVRTTTGATSLRVFGAADVDIQNVRVEGRMVEGGTQTGNTTAGILLDDLATGGITLVVRLSNVYVQACVGDGIRMAGLSQNLNQITIEQSRIQGNFGWGINHTVLGRGLSVLGTDVEGNTLGQINHAGPIGMAIMGCYFEASSTNLLQLNGISGGLGAGVNIAGNIFQGSSTNTAIKLGTTIPLEGISIQANIFSSLGVGIDFSSVGVNDANLGPNRFAFTTTDYTGRPGSGAVIKRAGDNTVQLTDHSVTPGAAVANTTTETTVTTVTLPGYTIDGNSGLRLDVAGEYTNNSGSNQNLTLRVYFKGTAIATFPFVNVSASSSQRVWTISLRVHGDPNNLTTAGIFGSSDLSDPTGVGGSAGATTRLNALGATSVTTTSTSGDLTVTAQHSGAAATVTLTRRAHFVESLPQ
ncbi:MAG: glycosyl hydrolase family 28-related protein [Gammaproteobacteria bacterium]